MLKSIKGLKQVVALALLSCAALLLSTSVQAMEDTICAVVKLEITQELTLERQGFEAIMKINNALEDKTLTDVKVDVEFLDVNGDVVLVSSDANHQTAKYCT